VLGTVPLLLKLKTSPEGLPRLSERIGAFVRTNSEALIGVTTRADRDMSEGIAITSVLHTDEHSHLEPVRYAKGLGLLPAPDGPACAGRERAGAAAARARRAGAQPDPVPARVLRGRLAKRTMILL